MKTKDFVIRIRYEDFKRAKRLLRPYPNESMANWFERLTKHLEIADEMIKGLKGGELQ